MPDGTTIKTSKAAVGFQYCTKLFSLEKKYIYADEKSRKDYLQNVVLPPSGGAFCVAENTAF